MSNLQQRLARLEKIHAPEKYKYMCVVYDGWARDWARREDGEPDKGYEIQPCISSFGGNGGAPFYLKTEQELKDFAARPDVDLSVIVVGDEDQNSPV